MPTLIALLSLSSASTPADAWSCGWSPETMARREASTRVVLPPLSRAAYTADRIGEYRVDGVEPGGLVRLAPIDLRRGVSAPVAMRATVCDGDVCTAAPALVPEDRVIVLGTVDRCGDLIVTEGVLLRDGVAHDLAGRPLVALYPRRERPPTSDGFAPADVTPPAPPGLTRADVWSAIERAVEDARAVR